MEIKEAKRILGKTTEKMMEIEIQETINTGNLLSDLCIDLYSKMSPSESKKYENPQKH